MIALGSRNRVRRGNGHNSRLAGRAGECHDEHSLDDGKYLARLLRTVQQVTHRKARDARYLGRCTRGAGGA